MRSYGQWMKAAAFGVVVVGLAVTSAYARRPMGRCCLPDGTCQNDMTVIDCNGAGGYHNANLTCQARKPKCMQPLPPDDDGGPAEPK
jgi:hypothetical protein